MAEGLVAMFRPSSGDVFCALQQGGGSAFITLPLAEARQIHATIGQALRHADSVGDPVGAVPDGPSWAVRRAVAAVVRAECTESFSAVSRFARRIEAGEADDSEPMRIGLAVAAAINTGGQV